MTQREKCKHERIGREKMEEDSKGEKATEEKERVISGCNRRAYLLYLYLRCVGDKIMGIQGQ